jgi:hypothetical protein
MALGTRGLKGAVGAMPTHRLPCSPRAARRVVSSEGDARKIVSENLQVYLSQSGASVDREASSARRLIEAALAASRRPSINEDV